MQSFFSSVSALAKEATEAATQAAAQAKTHAAKTQEEFRRVVNSATTSAENEGSTSGNEVPKADVDSSGETKATGLDSLSTLFSRAKDVAKDMANNAKATAEEAQGQLRELTANSAALLSAKMGGPPSEEQSQKSEMERYRVTEEMVSFVKGLTSDMFLAKSQEWPKEDNESWKLTPWQENHVLQILKVSKELRDCRYLLTPKKMSEQRFWEIYFALSQKLLFEGGGGKDNTGRTGGEEERADPLRGATEKVSGMSLGEEAPSESKVEDPGADGEGSEGEVADDLSDDLEAYLESVLANKDMSDEEGDGVNDDDDDDENLDDYINELEEDLGSISDDSQIVKVDEKDVEDAT